MSFRELSLYPNAQICMKTTPGEALRGTSAGFHPAVSPISNRQAREISAALNLSHDLQVGSPAIQQVGNQRHETTRLSRELFAKRVFFFAAIYGLVVLTPQYFLEKALGQQQFAPRLTHPEQFYGFISVALAWQCAFLLIAWDVARFRLIMLPAILEKVSFGAAAVVLYAQGRTDLLVACAGVIDLVFALCFVVAFRVSRGGTA